MVMKHLKGMKHLRSGWRDSLWRNCHEMSRKHQNTKNDITKCQIAHKGECQNCGIQPIVAISRDWLYLLFK
jgi:hypothetical protein